MRTPTTRRAAVAFMAVIAAMLSILASAGSASAVTLKGEWAPFNRCPVDDPSMLATSNDVGTLAICLAVEAGKGFLKIGGLSLTTGPINSQMGVLGSQTEQLFQGVATEGSGIVAPAQTVTGGLARLVCAKHSDIGSDICTSTSRPDRLNRVTSTLETAGAPSNFELFAALQPGKRIVTLPVKVHLQNPLLGPNCYIGSNEHPILLQPATTKEPETTILLFDAEGVPSEQGIIFDGIFRHTSQADTTFEVGTATGCGWHGRLDDAINHSVGLPSPAGANSMNWLDVSSYLIGLNEPTSTDGVDLSNLWHGAVIG
jgi:hypothetical protein